jgi:membrane dipeptidase
MPDPNWEPRAAELHRRAIVIDGHSDILIPIADGKARLGEWMQVPDPQTWQPPPGATGDDVFSAHTAYFGPAGQYSLPQLQSGGVTAQVCAIYLEDRHLDRALQRGLEMTGWLHCEVEENADLELLTSVADIHRAKREGKCGVILAFEGLEALGSDLRLLDLYYKLGLRMAGLTHSRRNLFADGMQWDTHTGGLTALGRQAVQRMNELGIVIDLAHLNQAGFWDILELSRDPVVLSHSSARPYFPFQAGLHPRYPPADVTRGRERLEALARNGGVFGVIFYRQTDLEAIVADIEHVIDRIGPEHVGLGSDFYGVDNAPRGLEDISRLPALTEALLRRGHSDEVVLKILGGNYLRVFEQVWKKA